MGASKNKSSPVSGLNGILNNIGESLNCLLHNGVNGTGAFSEGASSGWCPVGEQRSSSRHPATARTMCSKDVNKVVMECYLKSKSVKMRMECQLQDIGKGRFEGGRKQDS